MSEDTVIKRIVKKLKKADPLETLEAPRETWAQPEPEEEHGATTKLIMSVENEEVGEPAESPWNRGKKLDNKPIERKHQYLDEAGEPVHTEITPILTEQQTIELEEERDDTREVNEHGKKTDEGGGFDPYE